MNSQVHGGATSALEAVAVSAALMLCGLAAAVWAGAELAAITFGAHHRAEAGFNDALAAMPRLLAEPARPQQAWPARVATRLPGAVAYWSATLPMVTAFAVLAGVGIGLVGRGRVGVQRRRRLGVDPESRLAKPSDLLPLWVRGPISGRVVLGRVGGRLVASEDPRAGIDAAVPRLLRWAAARRSGPRGAVLAIGPSQCGKTSALAIPAILEWAGPVVALSVKSDLMAATIARRRRLGQVRVFDPVDVTAEPSSTWSPLRGAESLSGARRAARSIANATDWTTGSGEMGFWTAAGEDLLAVLFWTAATVGVGMDAVVGWVLGMEQHAVRELIAPLTAHADADTSTAGWQVLDTFDGIWRNDFKQISSVYLTARQMIRPWQEPGVEQSARQPEISLDWLLGPPAPLADDAPGTVTRHGASHPNTLYLCADLDDAERLAPVLGGLVDDLMKQAYARVGKSTQPLDPPLLLVIDEAGNWPMRNLPGRISTCAGLGIQLLLVYQSKAQIDAVYGSRADVVVSNAITKVIFSGVSDRSTLDYAASLLGAEHVTQRSASTDLGALIGGADGGRRSVTEAPTRTDLLPGSALRQVAPGQALLVHGTLRPAHVHGRYWYLDPDLHELATSRRRSRRRLARAARRTGRSRPVIRAQALGVSVDRTDLARSVGDR
jgi:type IV secretion system protein VirD4